MYSSKAQVHCLLVDFAISAESEELYTEMRNWLQIYQQPQSKLLEYWRRTAKKRLQYIHSAEAPSLGSVLQQWPRFKDSDGHILVSIFTDFISCINITDISIMTGLKNYMQLNMGGQCLNH